MHLRPRVRIRCVPCRGTTASASGTFAGRRSFDQRAREVDVVYTTGMFGRSAAGSTMARKPYVVKLTADPAFERSRRRGFVEGNVDDFQEEGGGPAVALLRFARDVELRHAAHVFTPSAYLRELALGLGRGF